MRAILIEPIDQTVSEIQVTGRDTVALRPYTGFRLAEVIMLDFPFTALLVDEEGLLKDNPGPFFTFAPLPQPMAGRGLVVRIGADGYFAGNRISLKRIQSRVAFPNVEFAGFAPLDGPSTTEMFGVTFAVVGSRAVFRPKEN